MVRCDWRSGRGKVLLVHADVETGLLKLLFHVDLILLYEGQQISAKPRDLGEREAVLGDVDRLTGEVGRSDIPFRRGRVSIDVYQVLLEFNRTNGRVDLQGSVEMGIVCASQGGKKLCGPGATVATIYREPLVDLQSAVGWKRHKQAFTAHVDEVLITLNASQSFAVGNLILTNEYLTRAPKRRRNDETATLVVKRRLDDR